MVVDHDDVAPSVGLGFIARLRFPVRNVEAVTDSLDSRGSWFVSWHLSSLCKRHVTYGISVKILVKICFNRFCMTR